MFEAVQRGCVLTAYSLATHPLLERTSFLRICEWEHYFCLATIKMFSNSLPLRNCRSNGQLLPCLCNATERERWVGGKCLSLRQWVARRVIWKILSVRPLDWRAERVSTFLHRLDSKVETAKTSQAKRQHKNWVESSEFSLCSKPVGIALPVWAITQSSS